MTEHAAGYYPTFLPCFPGFYESLLYSSSMWPDAEDEYKRTIASAYHLREDIVEALIECYEIIDEEFFADYTKDISVEYCEVVREYLQKALNTDVSIRFEKLSSPKQYNFVTDSVNCIIELDEAVLMAYLEKNKEALGNYLKREYQSGDGFISRYPTAIECWMDPSEWDLHQPGALLQFVLETWWAAQQSDDYDGAYSIESGICDRVLETVSLYGYTKCTPLASQFFEQGILEELNAEYVKALESASTLDDNCYRQWQEHKQEFVQGVLNDALKLFEDFKFGDIGCHACEHQTLSTEREDVEQLELPGI